MNGRQDATPRPNRERFDHDVARPRGERHAAFRRYRARMGRRRRPGNPDRYPKRARSTPCPPPAGTKTLGSASARALGAQTDKASAGSAAQRMPSRSFIMRPTCLRRKCARRDAQGDEVSEWLLGIRTRWASPPRGPASWMKLKPLSSARPRSPCRGRLPATPVRALGQ